jgi:hypothetical protein
MLQASREGCDGYFEITSIVYVIRGLDETKEETLDVQVKYISDQELVH